MGTNFTQLRCREKKKRVAAVPFASEHKFMCCWHRDTDDKIVMHVKGAPDRILPRARDQVTNDDVSSTEPIVTKFWEDKAAEMSAQVCVMRERGQERWGEGDRDWARARDMRGERRGKRGEARMWCAWREGGRV